MHTKPITLEQFLSKFSFRKDTSFREFARNIGVVKYTDASGKQRVNLDKYIEKNPSRGRKERLNTYKKNLYRMIVLEPEKVLGYWFNEYGTLPHDLPHYFSFTDGTIFEDGVFNGSVNGKYGRVCRSINFDVAHNTTKTNIGTHEKRVVVHELKLMFEEFVINYNLPTPVFFDMICDIDRVGYKDFWRHIMSFLNKPSILNPYTYREILHELFEGETLFAPCMSWNSCQIAFYNTGFKHFISTDVIPSVVENGRTLQLDWQEWNNNRSVIFPEDKTVDLYLCPSEQLQNRHKFIDKYRSKVDAVLFCPPYFDLELYDSPEQSVDSFPDYLDWLKGYWEETVKTCVEVMRPGARFGFIISNYSHDFGKTLIPVSDDMSLVASKYMRKIEKYNVRWSKFKSSKNPDKMKDGNFEDLWLFEKV
jgi:hypothetical protein